MNLVILSGVIKEDMELKYTGTGTAVATFTIHTTDKTKDGPKEKVVKCTMFGDKAVKYAELDLREVPIVVRGSVETKERQSNKGGTFFNTDVYAFDIEIPE